MKEIKKFKDAVKNLNISDNKEKKSKKEQDKEIIFKADSLKRDEEKPGFKKRSTTFKHVTHNSRRGAQLAF